MEVKCHDECHESDGSVIEIRRGGSWETNFSFFKQTFGKSTSLHCFFPTGSSQSACALRGKYDPRLDGFLNENCCIPNKLSVCSNVVMRDERHE